MRHNKKIYEKLTGVWSAAPTPLNERMDVDIESVALMVEHHVKIGINGIFLFGTNGEGPALTEKQKIDLLDAAIKYNKERMVIAVQITDNSSQRMIENAKKFADAGADILIMSSPHFFHRPDKHRLFKLYEDVLKRVNLPVGFYDRGDYSSVKIPVWVLKKLYKNEKLIIIKDSSSDDERMKIVLDARRKNKKIRIFNGDEFQCVKYLQAGYDGLLLGGGVFNGFIASKIIDAVNNKNINEGEKWQSIMNKIMYAVYGGKKIRCWLAGEKYLLKKMGIFSSYKNLYGYVLDERCKKSIDSVFEKYQDLLLPYKK